MKPEELQRLEENLKFGDDRERRVASYKLGRSNDPGAVPILIQAFSDPDSSVHQNVIDGLTNIRTKEALEFLIRKQNELPAANAKPDKITQKKKDYALKSIVIGVAFCGLGILLSAFSFIATFPKGGNYTIFGGMFVFGLIMVIDGMAKNAALNKASSDRTNSQPPLDN
jgi:hypothetical protein